MATPMDGRYKPIPPGIAALVCGATPGLGLNLYIKFIISVNV